MLEQRNVNKYVWIEVKQCYQWSFVTQIHLWYLLIGYTNVEDAIL